MEPTAWRKNITTGPSVSIDPPPEPVPPFAEQMRER